MLAAADTDTTTETRPVRLLTKNPQATPSQRWAWVRGEGTETAEQLQDRMQRDMRPIDLHGVAVLTARTWGTIKDMRADGEAQRKIFRAALDEIATDEQRERRDGYLARMLAHHPSAAQWAELDTEVAWLEGQILLDAGVRQSQLRGAGREDEAVLLGQAMFRYEAARDRLVRAMPAAEDYAGQAPSWSVNTIWRWARQRRLIDPWGQWVSLAGRPPRR